MLPQEKLCSMLTGVQCMDVFDPAGYAVILTEQIERQRVISKPRNDNVHGKSERFSWFPLHTSISTT